VKASLNGTPLQKRNGRHRGVFLPRHDVGRARVPGLELLPGDWIQGKSVGLAGSLARKALREATLTSAASNFKADRMPCVDLSRFSRALESRSTLVIGFPQLSRFVTEIDYRTQHADAHAEGK